jgi:hypothetical protein
MSCSAIRLDLNAICWTQLTLGLLLLKRATFFSLSIVHTCSIMSHNRTSRASSRSELVSFPPRFVSEMADLEIGRPKQIG